ncbi:MAG: hypothetical protein PW843_13035 [Azospirillaceae bacterium]|nr:hypothetical protein [Azospirillaceae bacterium]
MKILASDDFQGRKPGTVGEEKTVAYIQAQFKKAGLKPAVNGGYLQDVPMTEITSKADGPLVFTATGKDGATKALPYEYFTQMMIWTRQRTAHAEVKDSDLVFVGYGITAPEFGWDDYAGVDVKGKTVVILVNDPGFATGDPALFGGGAMTWYGRWPYKYEEAARHGAAAAIIVHETRAAGYPWGVVANSNGVPKLTLMPADGGLWQPQRRGRLGPTGRGQGAVRGIRPGLRHLEGQRRPARLQGRAHERQDVRRHHAHGTRRHLAQRRRRRAGRQASG